MNVVGHRIYRQHFVISFLCDTGDVFVQLNPYHFQVIGIESEFDLMSAKFGKYGEMNTGYTGDDVRGFSKIFGNQVSIYHKVNTPGDGK